MKANLYSVVAGAALLVWPMHRLTRVASVGAMVAILVVVVLGGRQADRVARSTGSSG